MKKIYIISIILILIIIGIVIRNKKNADTEMVENTEPEIIYDSPSVEGLTSNTDNEYDGYTKTQKEDGELLIYNEKNEVVFRTYDEELIRKYQE